MYRRILRYRTTDVAGVAIVAQLGMKRHNLQPALRESSDSLRQQAASTNLPMPSATASGNGVYAWALAAICLSSAVARYSSGVAEGREDQSLSFR